MEASSLAERMWELRGEKRVSQTGEEEEEEEEEWREEEGGGEGRKDRMS